MLTGGLGNDTLLGGGGNDTLDGGDGDDTYVFGLADGIDSINDSSGTNDKITIQANGAALSSLNFSDSVPGAGGNLLINYNGQQITITSHFVAGTTNVEKLAFSGGANYAGYSLGLADYTLSTGTSALALVNTILSGDSNGNTLTGNTGNDLLFGNADSDTLNGGAGNDLLVGGAGNDMLDGGDNDDWLVGGTGDDGLTGGNNIDTAVYSDAASGVTVSLAIVGAQTVGGGLGSDTLSGIENLTGSTFADALTGDSVANVLIGGTGNDTLAGGDSDDTYVFGLADGVDSINDSSGTNDKITIQASGAALSSLNFSDSVAAADGDLVISDNGQQVTVASHFAAGTIEKLSFSGGASYLGYSLGAADYTLSTGTSAVAGVSTILSGDSDGNTLAGSSVNDLLFGNLGNDTLKRRRRQRSPCSGGRRRHSGRRRRPRLDAGRPRRRYIRFRGYVGRWRNRCHRRCDY